VCDCDIIINQPMTNFLCPLGTQLLILIKYWNINSTKVLSNNFWSLLNPSLIIMPPDGNQYLSNRLNTPKTFYDKCLMLSKLSMVICSMKMKPPTNLQQYKSDTPVFLFIKRWTKNGKKEKCA
jgi:hypothetical protein